MTHEQLVERAKKAIEEVFSDTSVDLDQTLDSLTDLGYLVTDCTEAVANDLANMEEQV